MRVDHVSYVAATGGQRDTAARLSTALGIASVDGGVHPRFGTRNIILPLLDGHYVEVVEVLDHPASDKAAFGQAVRARALAGGGWLGWVVGVDDMAPHEQRLGREAVLGSRHRPDGVELRWRQLGVHGLIADPQLPYLVQWETGGALHPSTAGPTSVRLASLQIAGDPARVSDWLGGSCDDVTFTFVDPDGAPGLRACTFETPHGPVTL